jgi:hypothetical protein
MRQQTGHLYPSQGANSAKTRGIAMGFEALKVGELAKRTGLTIRTLHHYDEIMTHARMHDTSG